MSSLDEINDLEQAADYLKIEPSKLRRLVHERKIAYLKQGHVLTFPRAAITAYVEANTTAATPANAWGLTDAASRRIRGRSN